MSETCERCGSVNPTGRMGACPVCLLNADLPPARLGEAIELGEEIGRGGMGLVFRARHTRLDRTVAVKILPQELASQEEFRARFEREAKSLALMNHPRIVSVHDIGTDEGQSYIVMEFVKGSSLASRIPLSPDRALEVAAQVCEALSYAHDMDLVHRDIKPENILLDENDNVKVTDFGIARMAGTSTPGWTVTTPDVVIGTPHYIAPEAIDGRRPDPRMDLYSLGVVLYQMITGRLPVGDFEPLSKDLDKIIRKALAPAPENRYPSAEEMRKDLLAARQPEEKGGLEAEEKIWARAVALLQAISTGGAIWAFLQCITPRVFQPGESLPPLIMVITEKLEDGRILSWARFEITPVLAALAVFVVTISAYAMLRRHWRKEGLETRQPDRSVRESRVVLGLGLVALPLFGLRLYLQQKGIQVADYIPLLGGALELGVLYFFWRTVLEAWRTSRPLWREPFLWIGLFLALIPPTTELYRYIHSWKP